METETVIYKKVGRGHRSHLQEPRITISAKTSNIQFNKSAVLAMAAPGKKVAFARVSEPMQKLSEWHIVFYHPEGWRINRSGIISAAEAVAAIRQAIADETGIDVEGKRIIIPICRRPSGFDINSYSLLISKTTASE